MNIAKTLALNQFKCVIDAGSNPRWNESFLFTVSDNAAELNLRLMDEDTFTKDDLLGEVKYVTLS